MDLETFELMWPRRDQVDSSTRAELERLVVTDPRCRAFAEGGDWVREMLQELKMEQASPDFAYRMRVYAANHPESSRPGTDKPLWLRWPMVTIGAVAGVTAMLLLFGPVIERDGAVPGTLGGVAGVEPQPIQYQAPATLENAPPVESEMMLVSGSDSLLKSDSLKAMDQEIPDWRMHTVSTGE